MATAGRIGVVGLVAAAVLHAGAAAGLPAADKCESSKLKASGKLSSCQLRAAAEAVKTGETADSSKCEAKFAATWARAETGGMGQCPSNGDEAAILGFISQCTDDVAVALAGGALPGCPADLAACSAAVAVCQAQLPGYTLQTGQTTCYDGSGAPIACAGTGQDGELQKGLDAAFVDNGDGTITDARTGLMWEKLSQDGSIHDFTNTYNWDQAFSVHVAGLNSASFAGYSDWRLPNVIELQTLINYGADSPAASAAFNTGCVTGCTVTSCSCTQSSFYWSSTTYRDPLSSAWYVSFGDGYSTYYGKASNAWVRAVRGGP